MDDDKMRCRNEESNPNYFWTSMIIILCIALFLFFVVKCKGKVLH